MFNDFTSLEDATNLVKLSNDEAARATAEPSTSPSAVPSTLVEAIDKLDVEVARRVHAEEALREIEQRFRHLSEHTGKFLWISDPQTNQLIYVSPGYEEVWARSRENSYSSPESWRESFESNSGRRSGTPREREKLYQIAGPDGTPRWIRDRMFPVRDEAGEILRIVGVAEDITDAKRMHDELLRNENKLRAFLSVVPDLVFRLRKDGSILEFFASKDQSLLLPEANLIGKNIKHLLPPHLATEAMQHMAATLKSSQVQTFQYQYLLPDELRDFEVRAVTCGDDEVLALVRDVTDRKRLEREIIEATSREQQRIGQDLHDGLGQHLTGITFLTKALERKLAAQAPDEAKEAAEIGKLVLQALTQTRNLARGLFPVELETNGLIAALRDLAATVESTCKVHCTFRTDDSVVIQDNVVATHLFRIAQEALNNSIKHGKAKNLEVTLLPVGDKIELAITDDGSGFSPETKLDGLGLRIMQYRARRIGGTFDVKTTESGGTRVICLLPKKYESN